MIDLSELLYQPEFRQDFTIHRKTGAWQSGVFAQVESSFTIGGVVVPASSRDIVQIPEADRQTGIMDFFSDQEMFVTREAGADSGSSDELVWRGSRYRVYSVYQYADYGFFKATAMYIREETP